VSGQDWEKRARELLGVPPKSDQYVGGFKEIALERALQLGREMANEACRPIWKGREFHTIQEFADHVQKEAADARAEEIAQALTPGGIFRSGTPATIARSFISKPAKSREQVLEEALWDAPCTCTADLRRTDHRTHCWTHVARRALDWKP
jgi:hypothetical protein